MSTVGSLDAIAHKVQSVAGIRRCYSVGVAGDVRPIPRGLDDTIVGTVWVGSGSMGSGGAEALVISPTVDLWARADDAGHANKALLVLIDPLRAAFRQDMDLGGECTRCSMVGWDEPDVEEVDGRSNLVLPIRLEVLIESFGPASA